jgi:PadR family transcriptional regulator PadR
VLQRHNPDDQLTNAQTLCWRATVGGVRDNVDDLQLTPKLAAVLKVFLDDPDTPRYGVELMRLTGQASGTMYPNLHKLVAAGWLTVDKEDIDPVAARRPARRNYTITGAAVAAARIQLAALSEFYRPPAVRRMRRAPQGGLT